MSEDRFTDGNLITLYAIHHDNKNQLPDHIMERIKVFLQTFDIIIKSKPDGNRTMVLVIASSEHSSSIKNELIKNGIDEKIIYMDSKSKSVSQTINLIYNLIKTRVNPPFIYFVGPVWLKEVYDSIILSKLRGYKIKFEGALDHRSVEEVENEKKLDRPKKGREYYKNVVKNKALDMLLNYVFPENK